MEQVLASSLSGYSVMTTDGTQLGELENITVDFKTGNLQNLHVNPSEDNRTSFEETENGYIVVPATAVSAKNDYLLVEPLTP